MCATAYFVKLEDQLARLQLARLQLARAGSICDRSFEQLAFAATISASSLLPWEAGRSGVDMPSALQLARLQLARLQLARDQLARLQLARSKSVQASGVALQLARDQLARLQLARDQLARNASTAVDQLARLQLARV